LIKILPGGIGKKVSGEQARKVAKRRRLLTAILYIHIQYCP
jgi:hypothetical protein